MLLNPGCMVDYIYHFQLTILSAHGGFIRLWHQVKGQVFDPAALYKVYLEESKGYQNGDR